MLGVITCSH